MPKTEEESTSVDTEGEWVVLWIRDSKTARIIRSLKEAGLENLVAEELLDLRVLDFDPTWWAVEIIDRAFVKDGYDAYMSEWLEDYSFASFENFFVQDDDGTDVWPKQLALEVHSLCELKEFKKATAVAASIRERLPKTVV